MKTKNKPEVHYAPDYNQKCIVCDASPVVTLVDEKGKLVHNSEMCGPCCAPCCFGEAARIDPEEW